MKFDSLAISVMMLTGLVAGSQAATKTVIDAPVNMIRIANAVVANAYASNDGFPSERHERMADLAYMIGIWDLTSKAISDGGELLEARGTRSCVWVLDRTAIRCDDSVDAIRATADYPGLYDNHDQLFYLTFNESDGLYEYTYMSPTSADKQIYQAEFDESSKILTRFMHLGDNQAMPVRIWQVSDDEIRERAVIDPQNENKDAADSLETILNRKVPGATLTRF